MSGNDSERDEEGVHSEAIGVEVKEDEIIRKIILEMKKNSILHDISNPRYQKDRNKAIECTALKLKISPKVLRKKITYIKGQYTKQRDALMNAKKIKGRSGDALQDDFETKKMPKIWKWYDECHFLDDVDVEDMVETTLFSNYGPVKVNTNSQVALEAADLLQHQPERLHVTSITSTLPNHSDYSLLEPLIDICTPLSRHDPSMHIDADKDSVPVISQDDSESHPQPSPVHIPSICDEKHFEPAPSTSRDHHKSCPPHSLVHGPSIHDQKYFEPIPGTSRDHRKSRPPPSLVHGPLIRDHKYFEPVPGTSRDHKGSCHPSPLAHGPSIHDQTNFKSVPGTSRDYQGSRPPSPKKPTLSMRNQLYFEPILTSPQDQELRRPLQHSGILDTSPNVDTDIIFMILNVVHSFLQEYSRINQLRMLAELTAFLKDLDNKLKENKE